MCGPVVTSARALDLHTATLSVFRDQHCALRRALDKPTCARFCASAVSSSSSSLLLSGGPSCIPGAMPGGHGTCTLMGMVCSRVALRTAPASAWRSWPGSVSTAALEGMGRPA